MPAAISLPTYSIRKMPQAKSIGSRHGGRAAASPDARVRDDTATGGRSGNATADTIAATTSSEAPIQRAGSDAPVRSRSTLTASGPTTAPTPKNMLTRLTVEARRSGTSSDVITLPDSEKAP